MIFKCFKCGHLGFYEYCPNCGPDEQDENIPLDPEFYPEFQYKSKGLVKDLFVKKKTEKELQEKLDSVLQKYKQFEEPYFINYMHLVGQGEADSVDSDSYSNLWLFHNVLVRLGFDELLELPQLTAKLVRSTSFRFQFADFARCTKVHISSSLEGTFRSWIDDRGAAFREDLPMLLYYLWKNNLLTDEVSYFTGEVPYSEGSNYLVSDSEFKKILKACEYIYRHSRYKIQDDS